MMLALKPFLRRVALYSLMFLATVSAILAFLVLFVYAQFDGEGEYAADCALVFGAAVHKNSKPGPGIMRRTNTAIRLYKEGKVDTIFVSGGKGSADLQSEADVMKSVAVAQGVDPDDVITEGTATSTWENIENTRGLMSGCTNVLAISDRYHLARIGYLAYLQDTDVQLVPADRHANSFFEFKSVVREAFGILYYFLTSFSL